MDNTIHLVYFLYSCGEDPAISLVRIFTDENARDRFLSTCEKACEKYKRYMIETTPKIVVKTIEANFGNIKTEDGVSIPEFVYPIMFADNIFVVNHYNTLSKFSDKHPIKIFLDREKCCEYIVNDVQTNNPVSKMFIPKMEHALNTSIFLINGDDLNNEKLNITVLKYSNEDKIIVQLERVFLNKSDMKISYDIYGNAVIITNYNHLVDIEDAIKDIAAINEKE